MDASNHDMLGVLARELGSIFNPLATNIVRTNQENVETYQKISSQIGRMADFLGVPQNRRRHNQSTYQEGDPVLEQIRNAVPLPRPTPVERNQVVDLETQNQTTNIGRQAVPQQQPRVVVV